MTKMQVNSMIKLNYIDALRGLAILCVIMVHTSQYGIFSVPRTLANLIGEGARGVQLFYLASAFTLFISFKNRFLKEKFPIRNFFLRRFFRIAPMYYLGIAYYLFQNGLGPRYWLGDKNHITVFNILSNYTFLHGFNPYWINSVVPGGWSIGVEVTFYATIPILFFKIKNLNWAFNFFIISLIARQLLQFFFMKYHLISDDLLWGKYLFIYFPSQLPIFCLGILMYFIIIEKESLRNISGKSIILFCALLFAQFGTGIQLFFPNYIIFGIGFLLLALALSAFEFRLIINSTVIYIGKISFSMYLVHFAVLYWLDHFNLINFFSNGILNYCSRFFIVTFLTIFISIILYKTIELPFQEIGKRIIARLEKSTYSYTWFGKRRRSLLN